LTKALRSAVERGVRVDIVVETKSGATGLLNGPEPAAAFAAVPGVTLWHWPAEARIHRGSRQHAKIAVADSRLLLLGSANLTASGATRNIEAGILVRGGTAPQRAAEHVRELQRTGVLRRWDNAGE
jgi:phosphatidylserine/phosphatidylglycerophosphate/cardiolipin synthase-like enzyme